VTPSSPAQPHKNILDECWLPAFARHLYPRYNALSRELERYVAYYNFDRVHHGRLTRGRTPQTSSTVPARWKRGEPNLSARLEGRPA
jgi:hypothetical protein